MKTCNWFLTPEFADGHSSRCVLEPNHDGPHKTHSGFAAVKHHQWVKITPAQLLTLQELERVMRILKQDNLRITCTNEQYTCTVEPSKFQGIGPDLATALVNAFDAVVDAN